VAISDQHDEVGWERREGYLNSSNRFVPVVEVPKPARNAKTHTGLVSIRAQEHLGSLIAAGGTVWAVYVSTTVDSANLWRMQIMPPGPVEVCALGILAWLHAKWRRSMKVD